MTPLRTLGLALLLLLVPGVGACIAPRTVDGPAGFYPRSDYPIPPKPADYARPGDCRGGSRLEALELAEPDYPRRAFRQGLQGWVALRLDVAPSGETANVTVLDSFPAGSFDRAARATVESWRFRSPGEEALTGCMVVLDYRLGIGRIGF